jgi:hypothetical protein
MNYKRIYNTIIDKASQQTRKKKTGILYERHHILPKSLGGSNDKSNLVLLTPKEHYMCHRLLVEMYRGTSNESKMYYAMWCMVNGLGNQKRYATSSRIYNRLREHLITLNSKDRYDNRKAIEQYTLEGEYISTFNSPKEASEVLNILRGSIENCAREETKTGGGFNWKYVNSEKVVAKIVHEKSGRKLGSPSSNKGKKFPPGTRNIKYKEVFQYTLSMDLVKKWGSIQQASDSLQISRGSIENCARKTCKTSSGFIWRY